MKVDFLMDVCRLLCIYLDQDIFQYIKTMASRSEELSDNSEEDSEEQKPKRKTYSVKLAPLSSSESDELFDESESESSPSSKSTSPRKKVLPSRVAPKPVPTKRPSAKRAYSDNSSEESLPKSSKDTSSKQAKRTHIPSFPMCPLNYEWIENYIGEAPYSVEREKGIDTLMKYKQHEILYLARTFRAKSIPKDLVEWLKLAYRLKYDIEYDEGDNIVLIYIPKLKLSLEVDTDSLYTKFKGLDLFSHEGKLLVNQSDIEARRDQLLLE